MKPATLLVLILIFSSLSSATIATYTEDTVKQGPEAEYVIGVASDQDLQIELEVEEKEALNYKYNSSQAFDFDQDRVVQRGGEELVLNTIGLKVESFNVSKEEYSIPVVLRAYEPAESSGTTPQVIHEREYAFSFVTDLSPQFGLDGDLIDSGEEITEEEADEFLNVSDQDEENTLTNESQSTQEGEPKNGGITRTTYILTAGIVLLTLYTLKEAFT